MVLSGTLGRAANASGMWSTVFIFIMAGSSCLASRSKCSIVYVCSGGRWSPKQSEKNVNNASNCHACNISLQLYASNAPMYLSSTEGRSYECLKVALSLLIPCANSSLMHYEYTLFEENVPMYRFALNSHRPQVPDVFPLRHM